LSAPSAWSRLNRYRWLLAIALIVCGLDQGSKAWVAVTLPFNTYGPPSQIELIPGFFNLVHVGNTGAAWSLFSGRSPALALLALVTLAAIVVFRRQFGLEQRAVQTSFGLLCGGIVGNLFDRVFHSDGHVTDFLDFHFGSYVYPTFNLADSGIVCGVALYILLSLRQPATPPANPPAR
jgi:signal peptidase II